MNSKSDSDCAYLERVSVSRRVLRFYRLAVETNLFGDWVVVREWGRIGRPARSKDEWFASLTDARAALMRRRRAKERRGYTSAPYEGA